MTDGDKTAAKRLRLGMVKTDDILLRTLGLWWLTSRQCVSIGQRVRWITQNVSSDHCQILDAGCGGGAATFALALRGHDVTALDLEQATAKIAHRYALLRPWIAGRVTPLCWDLRRLEQLDSVSRFDCVVASEVIEHILDDRKLIRDLARLIRPGGRLLLSTPNRNYRGLWGDRVSDVEDGGHVRWGYSEEDLTELCRPAALRVESTTYIGGIATQKIINLRRRIRSRISSLVGPADEPLAMAATYPLRPLTFLDRLIPYDPTTIAVLATKDFS